MKRISFLLIIVLLISSVAYGSLDDKIGNHWSKTSIEENFMKGYFPYLVDDDFSEFSPNGIITTGQFYKSISLLFKTYNYETDVIVGNRIISREKMVDILGKELEDIYGLADEKINLPFKDIDTMNKASVNLLNLLYNLDIINGDSNAQFSPKRPLSQAEAIIILQRVRNVLNTVDILPFKVIGLVQTFSGQEEIVVIPQTDKVLVTITKEFPTPGYNMEIKNIRKTKEGYKINFDIQEPPKDSIQLQVITYKTISLEIDKEHLGDMPYNFILEGYNIIK